MAMPLLATISCALRRASFSLLAQQTVNLAYFGLRLPPAALNVLMTVPSSPAVKYLFQFWTCGSAIHIWGTRRAVKERVIILRYAENCRGGR